MKGSDIAYAEEWKFDHGIMVPLNFLTPDYDIPVIPVNINCQGPPLAPLERAWAFGESMRRACEAMPERIAIIGTGGISHWPATPDSGKINEEWDLDFMDRWCRNDKDALLDDEAYNDLRFMPMRARAVLRFVHTSPFLQQREGHKELCISVSRSPFLP